VSAKASRHYGSKSLAWSTSCFHRRLVQENNLLGIIGAITMIHGSPFSACPSLLQDSLPEARERWPWNRGYVMEIKPVHPHLLWMHGDMLVSQPNLPSAAPVRGLGSPDKGPSAFLVMVREPEILSKCTPDRAIHCGARVKSWLRHSPMPRMRTAFTLSLLMDDHDAGWRCR